MSTFLWQGKDAQGRVRKEEVVADNAQAARAQLVAAGWTELRLFKDEIFAPFIAPTGTLQ
jgi:type II secretory pathway component PulF